MVEYRPVELRLSPSPIVKKAIYISVLAALEPLVFTHSWRYIDVTKCHQNIMFWCVFTHPVASPLNRNLHSLHLDDKAPLK